MLTIGLFILLPPRALCLPRHDMSLLDALSFFLSCVYLFTTALHTLSESVWLLSVNWAHSLSFTPLRRGGGRGWAFFTFGHFDPHRPGSLAPSLPPSPHECALVSLLRGASRAAIDGRRGAAGGVGRVGTGDGGAERSVVAMPMAVTVFVYSYLSKGRVT